jgi:hypothetical protein
MSSALQSQRDVHDPFLELHRQAQNAVEEADEVLHPRRQRSLGLSRLGDTWKTTGELEKAIAALQEALGIAEGLTREARARP